MDAREVGWILLSGLTLIIYMWSAIVLPAIIKASMSTREDKP